MTTQTLDTDAGFSVTPQKAGALVEIAGRPDPATLDIGPILDAFHRHGAVLVDGLDLSREGFVAFTERVLDSFMEYVGGADNERGSALGTSSTVLTVTGGNTAKHGIPLHGEMFYTEPRPRTMFFCCMRPADAKGETTICDGVALWNALPDEVRRLFEERRVRYRRIYQDDAWKKVYKTDDLGRVEALCRENGVGFERHADGSIETVHICHAWHDHPGGRAFVNSVLVWAAREYIAGMTDSQVRFEDGSELSKEMLYRIHGIAENLTLDIPWKPGMLAIVDNMRVMHGRRSYEDEGRDIIMRLSLDPVPQAAA